jgi:hypothetical protein
MGLHGAGNATLATALAPVPGADNCNADAVRANMAQPRILRGGSQRASSPDVMARRSHGRGSSECDCRLRLHNRTNACSAWPRLHDLGRSCPRRPVRRHQSIFHSVQRFDLRVTPEGEPQYWAEQVCGAAPSASPAELPCRGSATAVRSDFVKRSCPPSGIGGTSPCSLCGLGRRGSYRAQAYRDDCSEAIHGARAGPLDD